MDEINIDSIEHEINDLCKILKTSRPEQYVYTYIKEIFPNAIRAKQFNWMHYNSEFDIFIPELDLAIEYDGFRWHKEKSDSDKNKLARQNKITIFRIREVGLKEPDCDYYTYNYNRKYDNIDKVINAIINFINIRYDKNIETIKKLDFDILKIKTLENLREQVKEQSLLGKWKEIEKYWDYKHNDGTKPEDVRPTSKNVFYAMCPYCNKKVIFKPYSSFYYYGKYSFTPHICEELDKYCIELLEKRIKNGKFELSMNILNDRRLKDWFIRIVRNREWFTTIKDVNILNELEKKIGFHINCKNLYEMKIADYSDLEWAIKRGTF